MERNKGEKIHKFQRCVVLDSNSYENMFLFCAYIMFIILFLKDFK
jgi:hypothetical protein